MDSSTVLSGEHKTMTIKEALKQGYKLYGEKGDEEYKQLESIINNMKK